MHEGASYWSLTRLVIAHFTSWNMVSGGLEKDPSEDFLSFGYRSLCGLSEEGFLSGRGEGRPVSRLPIVCEAAWTKFGGGSEEPPV